MNQAFRIIAAGLLLVLSASSLSALPYSDIYFFGDSLSDTGNTSYWTTDALFEFLYPDTPGPTYFEGRFSNGPVYSELLAAGLGLGPLVSSFDGGTNYAFGGAQTSGSGVIVSTAIDDVDEQVNDFLDLGPADPNALHVFLAGSNNFILGGETDESAPVADIAFELDRLASAGVQHLLVLNLPLFGLTPSYNQTATSRAEWNGRAETFNELLEQELDAFEIENPAVELVRLELETLLSDLVSSYTTYGFTNNTDSAAPGLEAGDSNYDESQIVAQPNQYLFWDGVHPTTAVHTLLAEDALRTVLPEGDYNRDGDITLADYQVWRDSYGMRWRDAFNADIAFAADGNANGVIDAADYTLWRDAYSLFAAGNLVPEPASIVLWFLWLASRMNGNSRRPTRRREAISA